MAKSLFFGSTKGAYIVLSNSSLNSNTTRSLNGCIFATKGQARIDGRSFLPEVKGYTTTFGGNENFYIGDTPMRVRNTDSLKELVNGKRFKSTLKRAIDARNAYRSAKERSNYYNELLELINYWLQ